jgi:hypothetical protein
MSIMAVLRSILRAQDSQESIVASERPVTARAFDAGQKGPDFSGLRGE